MPYYEEKPKILKSNTGFRLIALSGREYIDCQDSNHAGLRDYIYNALSNQLDTDSIDDYAHRYPIGFLATHITLLETYRRAKDMPLLLTHLRKIQAKLEKSYLERKEKGIIEMSDMPRRFPPNTEVVYQGDDGLIGGVVKALQLQFSFFSGPYYSISLRVIHAIKGVAEEGIYTLRIGFSGIVPIDSIALKLATDEDKEFLTKRGEKFVKFCKPGTYASYLGNITQKSYWSTRIFRADGRVVIDPISFERTQSETWREGMSRCDVQVQDESDSISRRNNTSVAEIKHEDYWRCISFMYGFAFAAKQWGRIELAGLSDIQWRDNAFEQLVLPEEDKDMIHSLVKFHGTGFTDIIEGKGGGCIFLLHGEPGFGKTSSAEAVAELLHKPLYSVSVGELGVDPKTLESSLRNILDVATIWDAVILLDEADIFLEERDEHDVERNAMVGVFLRLLEYHNGVLFLTTNRVEHFDRAFYSRISIALLYQNEEGKIPKIWHNLLGAAGLPQEWAKKVSHYDVNGRQIKNAIRMAQTLARAKGRKAEVTDLVRAVEAALRFQKEISKAKAATK